MYAFDACMHNVQGSPAALGPWSPALRRECACPCPLALLCSACYFCSTCYFCCPTFRLHCLHLYLYLYLYLCDTCTSALYFCSGITDPGALRPAAASSLSPRLTLCAAAQHGLNLWTPDAQIFGRTALHWALDPVHWPVSPSLDMCVGACGCARVHVCVTVRVCVV